MMLRDQYQGCMQEALKATKSLYWLSALSLVGNIILGMVQHSSDYWIAAIIVPAIFIPLALWSRRSPYEALLAAVILYILILLLDAVYDPKTLVQGFILKALIIGYLIKGVKAGAESKKIWGQLKEHHWIQAF
jgi:predicted branched-subunit amino acid permease